LTARRGKTTKPFNIEIVHGKRSISADTALRLSRFYGTSPQFWLNLQIRFDLENEKEKSLDRIEGEIHPFNKKSY